MALLAEIKAGLVLDQLTRLFDAAVPRQALSTCAFDLPPQLLDADLNLRLEEMDGRIDRDPGRILRK